jgi:arsenate reductase-like glutaredoxin family protein
MGLEVAARDFFQDRLSEEELREIIGDRPVAEFFSWASPSFRKMGIARESLGDDQLIAMMLNEPRLIRRPLVVVDGEVVGPLSGARRIKQALVGRIP